MPLFSKRPELPKLIACPFCSAQVVIDESRYEHWETHLIAVTDDNGDRAYIFECPLCGPSDLAYGARKPDAAARHAAAYVVDIHVSQRHGLRR